MASLAGSYAAFDWQFPDSESNRLGAEQARLYQEERRRTHLRFVAILQAAVQVIGQHCLGENTKDVFEHVAALKNEAIHFGDGFPVSVLCARLELELLHDPHGSQLPRLLIMLNDECARLQRFDRLCSKELLQFLTEHLARSQGPKSSYWFFVNQPNGETSKTRANGDA